MVAKSVLNHSIFERMKADDQKTTADIQAVGSDSSAA